MECEHFESERLRCWTTAWGIAREHDDLMPLSADPSGLKGGSDSSSRQLRQWWYLLTIGEEVPSAFLNVGLEGWVHRRGKPEQPRVPGSSRFKQWLPVYTRLLGVTGKLLEHVVEQLRQRLEEIPTATLVTPASQSSSLPELSATAQSCDSALGSSSVTPSLKSA